MTKAVHLISLSMSDVTICAISIYRQNCTKLFTLIVTEKLANSLWCVHCECIVFRLTVIILNMIID